MIPQEMKLSQAAAQLATAIAHARAFHEKIQRGTGDQSSRTFLADAIARINGCTDKLSWFEANISRYVAQSSPILSALRLRVADKVVLALLYAQLIYPSFDRTNYEAQLGYLLEGMNELEKETAAVLAGQRPPVSLFLRLAYVILDLESLIFHLEKDIYECHFPFELAR